MPEKAQGASANRVYPASAPRKQIVVRSETAQGFLTCLPRGWTGNNVGASRFALSGRRGRAGDITLLSVPEDAQRHVHRDQPIGSVDDLAHMEVTGDAADDVGIAAFKAKLDRHEVHHVTGCPPNAFE
jgi:hypothetical protein